jgi:hypothetical protein
MTARDSLVTTIAVAAALYALGGQPASADAMRCSSELKACISNCTKIQKRDAAAACVTNCRTRSFSCARTGCWDDGVRKYCGLMRQ